jgi:diaminopimelate epimerase
MAASSHGAAVLGNTSADGEDVGSALVAPYVTGMVRFAKYEGLGNDFVVIDERGGREPALPVSTRSSLCDRHRGVGGDGVLTILAPRVDGAVARMHITNADGSVPEMCGNGLRCVSLFLVDAGVVKPGQEHVVDTDAGPRAATVLDDGAGGWLVKVDMGPARFDVPGQIPAWRDERVVVDGTEVRASTVSMGNPHVILDVTSSGGEPSVEEATRLGRILEVDKRFPERTNVELAAVRADGSVDVVVWERGVGITEACGTGACGTAAVLARAGRVPFDTDVVVRLPGGPLRVRVPRDERGSVFMTGPARKVFEGTT